MPPQPQLGHRCTTRNTSRTSAPLQHGIHVGHVGDMCAAQRCHAHVVVLARDCSGSGRDYTVANTSTRLGSGRQPSGFKRKRIHCMFLAAAPTLVVMSHSLEEGT